MDGSLDNAAIGLTDCSEIGIDEGTKNKTAVGASLGVTLGRNDGLIDGATDGSVLEFTNGTELGMDDGMQDGTAVGDTL